MTVVVITVNLLFSGQTARQSRIPLSADYEGSAPVLFWYAVMDDGESLRGSTADNPRQTFIVEPFIGYELDDNAVTTELTQRSVQLRELFSLYFSDKTANELLGVTNRQRVKNELTERVNNIMTSGRVRDVAFEAYQVIPF